MTNTDYAISKHDETKLKDFLIEKCILCQTYDILNEHKSILLKHTVLDSIGSLSRVVKYEVSLDSFAL